MSQYDTIISNGWFFDGTGAPRSRSHIAIKDGRIAAIQETPFAPASAARELDAADKWVMPGFIDFHTHYDGEIEIDAGLSESVRHGVTTIFMGSCSLGACLGEPEDIADIFCRVEGIPRQYFLPLIKKTKTWHGLTEYFQHLDELPLGPNVCSFVPHSNIRMHAMGFEASLQRGVRATTEQINAQKQLLEEGLDAGYVGLSVQTLPWDKLDGDRERSKPLPSFFATWSEYRKLTRILRRRDRVFQGVPNIVTKVNVLLFLMQSSGVFRKPLRTTVISMVDLICNRSLWWGIPLFSRFFNLFLRADFRFQALPNPFDVWADGMELVIFEEFAAGAEAIHLSQLAQRSELLLDPEYRRRFKKQWGSLFSPRVYHRDFSRATIVDCPEKKLVGKTFSELAKDKGHHAVEVFLDLCAKFGDRLRWYSVIGNDRPKKVEYISRHPDILVGFSDAGAHLRNMAFYNYPLRLLKLARDAEERGEPFMSIERAVHRLAGEPASWFRIDAGHLAVGKRADVVIVEPSALDETLAMAFEEEMPAMGGLRRMVRRNPKAVPLVMINGQVAVRDGIPTGELGKKKMGRVLRVVD